MANKKFNSWIKNICMGWGFIMAGSMLSSCNDLMHDDLPPCDMGVDLQFKYDYNVQRADMFKDHVGGLSVFVYDEQGNFIARHDAYNDATSQPLKDPNYAMRINLEPGKYRFATFAFQKKYEDALAQPGAKFQIALPQQGDNITALHARLDREQGKVNNQSQPLDTLWQGLSNELVEVKDLQVTRHTIGLVRDTKQLTISLHQTDEPANINADDFSYQITNANGDISYDNSLLPDEELTYTPYYTWTTEFKDTEGNVKERTAHAALMFSRLIWHPAAETTRTPSSPSRTRLQAKRWYASILLTVWLKVVAPSKPANIQHRNSWTVSTTTSSTSSSRATSGSMCSSAFPSWIGASASSVSISNRFRCQSPFRAFSS